MLKNSEKYCCVMTFGFAVLLLAAGCTGKQDAPELVKVAGTVTFDDKPVETGRIMFRKSAGDKRPYSAEIKNGKYELKTEPGTMKVEITASRLIPGKFDSSNGTPEPVGEMYIPAEYNSKTTLTAEIEPSGNTSLPFDLTSKAKGKSKKSGKKKS